MSRTCLLRRSSCLRQPQLQALGIRLGIWGALALAAGSAATSACLKFDPFGCQEDTQCDAEAMGLCDVSGWCSYPDVACENGYRFEANAGDGLGGECVGADPTGTGPEPSTSNATEPPLETSLDSSGSTITATTGPDPTGTSSDDEPTTGPTCGGSGEACCAGDSCDAGLSCTEGLCGCVQSVAVGDRHTCVIKLDGSVWCWGANDLGQLATDPAITPSSPVPVEIAGAGPVPAVEGLAARRHTCALRSDETLLCWGDNTSMKANAMDPAATVLVPAAAAWAVPAMQLGVGGTHTCVGRGARQAPTCWGDNSSGQLTSTETPGPVFVAGGFEPFTIAMGSAHTCMSTLTGQIFCWGANGNGQLAVDPAVTPTSNVPLALGLPPVGTIAAGTEHTCATTGSDVQCWGRNNIGQLGIGTNVDTFTPTLVAIPPGSGNVAALVAAADQTCVVMVGGAVLCWGGNQSGELLLEPDMMGEDGFALSPRAIELGFSVAQLATGVTHSCALGTDGQVRCWGDNAQGQIGDGTVTDALEPTPAQISCP
jgi:alpha-tubulin suppressor-like RCC1 family protein